MPGLQVFVNVYPIVSVSQICVDSRIPISLRIKRKIMPARPQLGVSFCKNKVKTSQTWLILAVSAAESSQDVYGRPPRSKGYTKMINTMNTRNNIPNIWSHDLLHKVIHDLLHNGMAGWVWRGWIVWAGWCVWAGRSRKTCLYGQEVRCISF